MVSSLALEAERSTGESTTLERCDAITLSGGVEILRHAPLLRAVAERFNQSGAMHWLEYFFGQASHRKLPILVLLVSPGTSRHGLTPELIMGCTLFSEYILWGCRVGVVVTQDESAFRTVLAPKAQRAGVGSRCAAELLRCGAQIVLTTFEDVVDPLPTPVTTTPAIWTSRIRDFRCYLDLKPTFAATLAGFDRDLRYRITYFRRRFTAAIPCTLVPEAQTVLSKAEFLTLNRGCLNPISDEESANRWDACSLPGGYALGLKTVEGRWLCLVGGWRQDDTTVMHWQMNMAGWEKYSLSSVMRSFFLEDENQRGTRRVVFYGGTPHSLRHAFPERRITDLLLRRMSLRARILLQLVVRFASRMAPADHDHFLAEMLVDRRLIWKKTTVVKNPR